MYLKHELGGSVKELQVGAKLGEVTEPNKMSPSGYCRGELLERLQLKHEPVGSVKELQVGANVGKVTEPTRMCPRGYWR